MRVLVVNAGSSSLKLRLLDGHEVIRRVDLSAVDSRFDAGVLSRIIDAWPMPDVVGHRIVHGGTRFTGPARIDAEVEVALRGLSDLAPLHQPKSLAAYDAVTALLRGVPAVACFDTAFHGSMPAAAATYAVPSRWREHYGVRRYGFHGLSHAYVSRRAAELVGRSLEALRMVTCHLGAGASLAAIVGGRSVDTTMGFTPLEGLVMATRSGSVDPGLVLWLQEHEHLGTRELAVALEKHSGLLGIAGTADMREVEHRAAAGDDAARLAFDVFVHRLVAGIGAMSAATGGLDALVFTGGIGEHSAGVRRATCARLAHLGAELDLDANAAAEGDIDISRQSASTRTLVIESREDLEIAREASTLAG